MGFTEPLRARAVFVSSIKGLGWQPVAQKFGSTIFRKKRPDFLKFIGPATPPWVLQSSQIIKLCIWSLQNLY